MGLAPYRATFIELTDTTNEVSDLLHSCASQLAEASSVPDPTVAVQHYLDEFLPASKTVYRLGCRMPDRSLCGMVGLYALSWDSSVYGCKMGRVDSLLALGDQEQQRQIKRGLLQAVLREARGQGYRHLTGRVNVRDHSSLHALEDVGFRCMDVQITLLCLLRDRQPLSPVPAPPDLVVAPYHPHDLASLQTLSAAAFKHSRFFVDTSLPGDATKQLHAQWVYNDCNGRAQLVVVARMGDQPVGYIACLLHPEAQYGVPAYGEIDLIAVSPDARRMGIGSALLRASLDWFQSRVDRVLVRTQLANYPALSMYQRIGFVVERAQNTLHFSID